MRFNPFAKDQEMFSPFAVEQKMDHCGPCSLSSCLFMLGIEATQKDLARAAEVSMTIHLPGNWGGTAPNKLLLAMNKYNVTATPFSVQNKNDGNIFTEKLIIHLSETGPAMLSTQNGDHWIAAVGYFPDKSKFVIYDPQEENAFYLWSHSHLLRQISYVDDNGRFEYPALLIRRKDGQPPVWNITEKWMKIHNRGSDCTAVAIASDLRDLVKNAYNDAHQSAALRDSAGESIRLSELLETYRSQVLDAILYWQEGSRKTTKKGLKDLYSDYVTCADACRLHISKNAVSGPVNMS